MSSSHRSIRQAANHPRKMALQSESEWEQLCQWARKCTGLQVLPSQVARLQMYVETLSMWNRKMALVSRNDADRIVSRHIADSLFVAAHCADGDSIVDLGSGAGFPGLPIAIVRAGCRVSLIESRAKKASFLNEAVRVTRATNATVCHGRIESVAQQAQHRSQHNVAIARALTSTDEFFAMSRAFLAAGGRAIAMKSTLQDTEATATRPTVIRYQLPDGSDRLLLIAVLSD